MIKKAKDTTEQVYSVETLKQSDEFSAHADILGALFNNKDRVTKQEARAAIKKHNEREVN